VATVMISSAGAGAGFAGVLIFFISGHRIRSSSHRSASRYSRGSTGVGWKGLAGGPLSPTSDQPWDDPEDQDILRRGAIFSRSARAYLFWSRSGGARIMVAGRWIRPGIGEKSARTFHAGDSLVPLERSSQFGHVTGESNPGRGSGTGRAVGPAIAMPGGRRIRPAYPVRYSTQWRVSTL
jgi:hypothetical protein